MWLSYYLVECAIEVRGEAVAPWINVNRGVEGFDVDCLFDTPLGPVLIGG